MSSRRRPDDHVAEYVHDVATLLVDEMTEINQMTPAEIIDLKEEPYLDCAYFEGRIWDQLCRKGWDLPERESLGDPVVEGSFDLWSRFSDRVHDSESPRECTGCSRPIREHEYTFLAGGIWCSRECAIATSEAAEENARAEWYHDLCCELAEEPCKACGAEIDERQYSHLTGFISPSSDVAQVAWLCPRCEENEDNCDKYNEVFHCDYRGWESMGYI